VQCSTKREQRLSAPKISSDPPVTFKDPPLGEVALSIQFAEPVIQSATILDTFRSALLDRFPRLEVLSAAARMAEDFSDRGSPGVTFQLLAGGTERIDSRFWFLSADDREVVQIQGDRIAFNWRKSDDGATYPRYEQLKQRMLSVLGVLKESVGNREGGLPADWCEVNYLNPLPTRDTDGKRVDISEYLNRFQPESLSMVSAVEDTSLRERYLLHGNANAPIGRLIIDVSPAFQPRLTDGTNEEIHLLRLTARGRAASTDLDGAMDFLDYGHQVIVTTFKEITTPTKHELWGLE
jgi:uncharacterized protein (TIGR04255 family)